MEKALDPKLSPMGSYWTLDTAGRVLDLSELPFIHLQNALTLCLNQVLGA